MKKVLTVFLALSILLVAGYAIAEKPTTPESIDGVTRVDSEWVKANMNEVRIYDVRKKGEYVEKHLLGAISAPYKEKSAKKADFDASKDKLKMNKFPTDKNAQVVVYCNGKKCWKSYKSAVTLARAGYKRVYWLREGFPGWQSKGYPVE